jgi:hypothetical protein
MKKLLLFIVTFAYLATSSGASIYIHECMGKAIEWNLKSNDSDKCPNCGMHKNAANDCCKDHVKVIKVPSDQQLPEAFFKNLSSTIAVLPAPLYSSLSDRFLVATIASQVSETPLRRSQTNYCILYCTFLI